MVIPRTWNSAGSSHQVYQRNFQDKKSLPSIEGSTELKSQNNSVTSESDLSKQKKDPKGSITAHCFPQLMPLLRIFLIAHVASTGRRVHVSASCCARFSASKSKVAMHSWKCGAKNPNILSNAFMDGCEMKQSQNDHQKPNRSHNRSCFCCYSSYLLPSSASPPAKQSTSASTSSTCLMLELELESILIHLKFKTRKD